VADRCGSVARASRAVAGTLALLALAGCATTSGGERHPADPFEPANRAVFRFNDAVDRAALKPVAEAYRKVTPDWFRTGVGNFFNNLFYPNTIVNQALQGKFQLAAQDLARFLINSTFGVVGLVDLAGRDGLEHHDEDFGQTLGVWGVPPGPYLMLPLLGPATLRDAPNRVAENFLQPFYWYNYGNERWFSLALSLVDTRARLLPAEEAFANVYDRYAFLRDAYLQRRQFKVYDGNPPEEPFEEEFDDAPDEAAAPRPDGSDGR